MKKALLFLSIIFLAGCATTPTPQQLHNADYGTPPTTWEKTAPDILKAELVRPETLYIRKIEPPVKAWIVTPTDKIMYGWGVCGLIVSGISSLQPFFILYNGENHTYLALGFDLAKQPHGNTWARRGAGVQAYDNCPDLLKN